MFSLPWIALGFLSGSVPYGYLVVKLLLKIDIRSAGSGNPGATNVFRVAGAKAGIVTLILDAAKGSLPVIAAHQWAGGTATDLLLVATGFAAITGHILTPFLGFRGGKGVATATGVFAALMPVPFCIALVAFGIVFALTRIVSISSLSAATLLPLCAAAVGEPLPFVWCAAATAVLVWWTHRSNLIRLARGTERRFVAPLRKPGAS